MYIAPAISALASTDIPPPYVAGTSLVLRCQISVSLQGAFALSTQWLRNGSVLIDSNDGRIQIQDVQKIYEDKYVTYVVVNTLSKTLDAGTYTCKGMVDTVASNYVMPSLGTAAYKLDIQGETT